MADPIPTSTSYSDPIYDRLDSAAQRLARRWPLVVAVVVIAVLVALGVRWFLHRSPEAASARLFVNALDEVGDDRAAALQKVVDDAAVTPYFRSRAACELVQLSLTKGKLDEARSQAERAVALARDANDRDLELQAQLTYAAALEDGGKLDEALVSYDKVRDDSGGKYPDQWLAAQIGGARVLHANGKLDDAITRLSGVVDRKDEEARELLQFARLVYWQYKREAAEAAKGAGMPAQPAPEAKPAESKPGADAQPAAGSKPAPESKPATESKPASNGAAKPAESKPVPAAK